MSDLTKQLDKHVKELVDLDRRRQKDPLVGRQADEKMMAVCQFLKDHKVEARARSKALETIKALNLRPYWNYCREHMLDVGFEF